MSPARRPQRWLSCLILTLGLLSSLPAQAHKPSDSYLTLRPREGAVQGHWDIALRDLDRALTLDENGDGDLTWGELRSREGEVRDYARENLTLRQGGQVCTTELADVTLVEHSDGRYARLPLNATCTAESGALTLSYRLLFDLDAQHRSVVRVLAGDGDDTAESTFVLSSSERTLTLPRSAGHAAVSSLGLVRQGIGHILSGLDHVLFLLALLLPSVLRNKNSVVSTSRQIRAVLGDVVRVVTAFTVAHSLTLALAALGVVSMSAEVIEPAIAASVALAALDNLWPVFGGERWSIAFALGLLHGFGFSSALSDLGLSGGALLRGLVSFNVGVELGQLAIVSLFVPLAFLLRNERFYRFACLRGGSVAIAGISLVWFVERVLGG